MPTLTLTQIATLYLKRKCMHDTINKVPISITVRYHDYFMSQSDQALG